MPSDYVFLKLCDTEEQKEMVKSYIANLMKKISLKWYYKNLIKKLPYKLGTLNFIGDSIPCVMLPFTEEQLDNISKEYVDDYIERIMKKLDVNRAYCIGKLQNRDQNRSERERTLLKFLYLKELVTIARRKLNITMKDMKLVVIDSGDKRIEHVLELLVNNLNFLTIITDREEYFTEFRDMIYDTTGLVVDVEEIPLKNHIEGNIIIDLKQECYKQYILFPENSYVIDVNSSQKKRQYIQDRRKDLTILYDINLWYQNECIKQDILVNYLRAKSMNIESIYGEYYRNINQNEIMNLLESCHIQIDEVCI